MRPFTLMELLIVMAIIALLASMLFPALKVAMDTGKKIACVNHLKTLYTGYRFYSESNDGWMMPRNNGSVEWPKLMAEEISGKTYNKVYWKDTPYYQCPSYRFVHSKINKEVTWNWISYGYNSQLSTLNTLLEHDGFIKLEWSVRPSKVYLFADSDEDGHYGQWISHGVYLIGTRHSGFANMTYLDGHVGRKQYSDTDVTSSPAIPGTMNYSTGAQIVRSTGGVANTTLTRQFWGVIQYYALESGASKRKVAADYFRK